MNSLTKDLIILNAIPGFGYERLKNLLDQFGTTTNIINSQQPDIIKARQIFDVEKEIEIIEKEKIKVVTILDADYPDTLKQIYSPPIVLYIKGQIQDNAEKAIAVVGSRNCTQYGKNITRRICLVLAKFNIVVVSGMARGIDTVAHKETLVSGGETIAVLGSGLKHIYPTENKKLSEQIIQNGLLISEFPLKTAPLKENFPRRNRIISGLSKGVVVVEAPEKSGALITADFALEQGREVFAVPGNVDSLKSKGCNNLIKQGAKLVDDAFDIIEEVFPDLLTKELKQKKYYNEKVIDLSDIPAEDKKIYELLSAAPIDVDSLTDKLNLPSQQIISSLLHLELKRLIKQLPGKLYIRER